MNQPPVSLTAGARWRNRLFHRASLWSILYLLMMPTIVGLIVFTYFPNLETIKYAFYKWDGSLTEEFTGLSNFIYAFTKDPRFWNGFGLVGIFLLANLIKMWPSIFVAIALHRLKNTKWQYVYRVLFVLPMVIPGMVMLLIWKAFYTEGLLNQMLTVTGGMAVLRTLDSGDYGLPALAGFFQSTVYAWNGDNWLLSILTKPVLLLKAGFGSWWGMALWGAALLVCAKGLPSLKKRWLLACMVGITGMFVWGSLHFIPLVAMAVILPEWLISKDRHEAQARIAWIAWGAMLGAALLIILTEVWVTPTQAFKEGNPPWLGHSKLVIPAIVFWGFPWVGTVGVLIYLAGLQNISQEVYEAADLDGVSSLGKVFRIELPLILTQVRINLIFMTIGTLGDFGMILILLGPSGGPDNVGMVPGLYMYNKAFIQGEMGYACTLAMVMFLITLALTFMYQRFVKVEK